MHLLLHCLAVISALSWFPQRACADDAGAGIVTNQTMTVAGQEFYQQFASSWRDRDPEGRYALSVTERPSARWGSQVWIEHAQRRVLQVPLPTSRAGLRQLGEQAADATYKNIIETELQGLLSREADLGRDEL